MATRQPRHVPLAVVMGLGLFIWLGVWLRMIWIRRQLRKRNGEHSSGGADDHADGQIIEAEYTVISRKRDQ